MLMFKVPPLILLTLSLPHRCTLSTSSLLSFHQATPFSQPLPLQVQACADEAERLLAAGQYADAAEHLLRAIGMGHLPSRALMAWLLVWGRKGIAKDTGRALDLAKEGVRMGCNHCRGVQALCIYHDGGFVRVGEREVMRDDVAEKEQLALELVLQSSQSGSRYGHYVLGELYSCLDGDRTDRALLLLKQAADQGLDEAVMQMGYELYMNGMGSLTDRPEALRLFQLAADQGHPGSLFAVGYMHELGHGVPADDVEAIVWYKRAAAAGHNRAATCVQKLEK